MYILNIDINAKVGQQKIDRLVRIHETLQDPVVVIYTEQPLPDGFAIVKFDGLVEHYVKGQLKSNPKYLEQNDGVRKSLHKQKERLSKEKYISL